MQNEDICKQLSFNFRTFTKVGRPILRLRRSRSRDEIHGFVTGDCRIIPVVFRTSLADIDKGWLNTFLNLDRIEKRPKFCAYVDEGPRPWWPDVVTQQHCPDPKVGMRAHSFKQRNLRASWELVPYIYRGSQSVLP